MPEPVVRCAALLLALVFGWSGAIKVVRRSLWLDALRGYRLPRALESVAAPLVSAAELLIAGALVAGTTRAGAAAALALLSAFSLAVLRARALQGDRLPCGCMGGRRERDYRSMIARNAALACVAALLLVAGKDVPILAGMRLPRSSELVPAALVAVAVVVLAWLLLGALVTLRKGQP